MRVKCVILVKCRGCRRLQHNKNGTVVGVPRLILHNEGDHFLTLGERNKGVGKIHEWMRSGMTENTAEGVLSN